MTLRIAIGLLAFIVGLAIFLPARTVAGWVAPQLPDVGLHDVSGTAYRAHVDSITYRDTVVAEDVDWRWQPAALLLARGAGHVTGKLAGGLAEADVAATALGGYRVDDLRAALSVADVLAVANMDGIGITGDVGIRFPRLRAKGQTITDVDGQIDVVNLAWQFGNKRYLLGNFTLTTRMEDGRIVGDIADADGPVAAEGAVQVDPVARTWSLDGRVRPRSSADPVLANLMSGSLGRPGADGWFPLRRNGRF